MKSLLAIATYQRPKKLQRLLNSLNSKSNWYDVVVIQDNMDNSANDVISNDLNIKMLINHKQEFVIGSWNRAIKEIFIKEDYQYFCGLCDDVQFEPNTLKEIIKYHKENFSDTDGVVGFNQKLGNTNEDHGTPYGQTLIGREFIKRYKNVDYKVCCPYYKHFYQDFELYQYALSLNKFKLCENAILRHYHPCKLKEELDEIHYITRGKIKKEDDELFKQRQEMKKLWPLS